MTDFEQVVAMLDRANQPHFEYTQIGESGNYTVMVLDDERDGGREVALLFFDLKSKVFVMAGTRERFKKWEVSMKLVH